MRVLYWIWSIVRSVLNSIARAVVFVFVLAIVLVTIGLFAGDGLPGNMVLELDLRKAIEDKSPQALFDLTRTPSVMDVVLGLDAAARDPRVKGVFMRVGSGDLSIPKAEELRDALKHFKASGKFVIAHSQSFYSSGLGDYEVAAGADQIWMQPVSTFFSAGTASTTLFFKGLFDKVDAVPQFVQRYEYKNAANVFTETDFTPPHREATMRLLQSWYDSAVEESAADRKLDKAALTAVLDEAPVQVEEVQAKGLITNIGYDEEARDAALKRAGANARDIGFARYLQAAKRAAAPAGATTIAFVHAAGDIVEGGDANNPLDGGAVSIPGDDYARAIRQAAADRTVKAILLRVDSPGGSAIASDQILDAVKKAQAAGKPVVVSMGSVAASGGYYISTSANKIVAEPGTITGSIGVLWGKFAVGKTAEKIGVEARELGIGKNALFLSGITPWDDSQLAKVNAQADAVYADFTKKVSDGRKIPLEKVQEIARGRVWSGADAKERGLVDDLGGFWTAIADVKTVAGIDQGARVTLKEFPSRQGIIGTISRMFDDSATTVRAFEGLNALLQVEPVRALIAAVRDIPEGRAELTAAGLPPH